MRLPSVRVTPRRHAQTLGLVSRVAALGAGVRFVLLVRVPLALDVVVAEADLALHAGVLPVPVAGHALVVLSLEALTGRLVLELVVLAEKSVAEGTLKHPSTVVPHPAFAFETDGTVQRTLARVHCKTVSAVADPRLADITNRPDHLHPCRMSGSMPYNTVG